PFLFLFFFEGTAAGKASLLRTTPFSSKNANRKLLSVASVRKCSKVLSHQSSPLIFT
uniref:Uncharacterized protein n=1 Tax=Aegilops tauschii subsp. strangulata TaxID=200361 RepID=A0A453J9Q3_AEGTS